jgi:hypothetical protein
LLHHPLNLSENPLHSRLMNLHRPPSLNAGEKSGPSGSDDRGAGSRRWRGRR